MPKDTDTHVPLSSEHLNPPGSDGTTHAARHMSAARRYALLVLFCLAQFIDASNGAALYSAIPVIKEQLDLGAAEAVWLISSFGLTFASFLLLSGRLCDVFYPERLFTSGMAILGLSALGAGFLSSSIPLLVLRALMGCAAALTIPSAFTLIVLLFPSSGERSRAMGAFGASGALGNVLGLLFGAMFVQWASWRWVFWFIAMAALPIAGASALFLPSDLRAAGSLSMHERIHRLDLPGVSMLTVALILIIYGVTSGSTYPWSSVYVIAPLIIGTALVGAFLWWEMLVDPSRAVVPPRTWFYPNFGIHFFVALLPFFWWACAINMFIPLWQTVYGWSAISAAVRAFPIGGAAILISFTSGFARFVEPKWLLLIGLANMLIATVLFQFSGSEDSYWRLTFPGLILGSAGAMMTYTNANIAVFGTTPSDIAGTIGAIFVGGLQLGAAVGYAVAGSIQSAVDAHSSDGFAGCRAAFRMLIGFICIELFAVVALYRTGIYIHRV